MVTDNPPTGPSDDTYSDTAASNSETTIMDDKHGDDTDNMQNNQNDIVLKHIEVNFVPHITK